MTQDETDKVYMHVIQMAIDKGWSPRGEAKDGIHWAFAAGTFYTKNPIWKDEKIVEQLGACSVEKLIFDHEFAKVAFGEEYTMVLTGLAMLPATERPEYLKLSYIDGNEELKTDLITEV